MANTLATLPEILADAAVPVLDNRLAGLDAFGTTFTTEGTRTIEAEKHTVVGAVQTNPTAFNVSGDTTTLPQIAVSSYNAIFGITAPEQLQGHRLENRAKRHAHALADKVWDVVAALLSTSNYTNTPVTVAQASLAGSNIKALRASIAKANQKTLVLDGTAYSEVMTVVGRDSDTASKAAYSFDAVEEVTKWDNVGTANVYGFAAGKESMIIAAGIPQYTDKVMEVLEEEPYLVTIKASLNENYGGVDQALSKMEQKDWNQEQSRK